VAKVYCSVLAMVIECSTLPAWEAERALHVAQRDERTAAGRELRRLHGRQCGLGVAGTECETLRQSEERHKREAELLRRQAASPSAAARQLAEKGHAQERHLALMKQEVTLTLTLRGTSR
jgi:hypothetical protein